MTKQKHLLYAFIGPSGVGKTTLVRQLFDIDHTFVSFTTRAPREGEVDGIDYYFITPENAKEMKANGETMEFTQYDGNYYGYPKDEKRKLQSGDCAVIVTLAGLKALEQLPDLQPVIRPIFMCTSRDIIAYRLSTRAANEAEYLDRIKLYNNEVAQNNAAMSTFPYNRLLDASGSPEHTCAEFYKIKSEFDAEK